MPSPVGSMELSGYGTSELESCGGRASRLNHATKLLHASSVNWRNMDSGFHLRNMYVIGKTIVSVMIELIMMMSEDQQIA